MAPATLFDMSVPIYIRQLESLRAVMAKGQQWASENGKPESELTEKRLVPDMLPFTFQVQTCCNIATKTLARVAGLEMPVIADDEKTFAELDARVARVLEILAAAKPAEFEGKESTPIVFQAGPAELTFDGLSYIQEFGLPNVLFHHTMAYALLREAGVPLGKFDFLGSPSKGMTMKK